MTLPELATRRHTPDVPLGIAFECALATAKIILSNRVSGWRVISNADLEGMEHVVRNQLEGRTSHNAALARESQPEVP